MLKGCQRQKPEIIELSHRAVGSYRCSQKAHERGNGGPRLRRKEGLCVPFSIKEALALDSGLKANPTGQVDS